MSRSSTIAFLVVTIFVLLGGLAWIKLNPQSNEIGHGPPPTLVPVPATPIADLPPAEPPVPIAPITPPAEPEPEPDPTPKPDSEPIFEPKPDPGTISEPFSEPKVPLLPLEQPKKAQSRLEGVTVKIINSLPDKVLVGSGVRIQHRGRVVVLTSRLWFEGRVGRISMRIPDGRDFFPRAIHVDREFDLAAMVIESAGEEMSCGSLGQNPEINHMIYLGGFQGPASDDEFQLKAVRATRYVQPKGLPVNADWIIGDDSVPKSMVGGPAFNVNGELVGLTIGIRTGDSRALVCCPGRIAVFLEGMK
jgi:hypothetical protein